MTERVGAPSFLSYRQESWQESRFERWQGEIYPPVRREISVHTLEPMQHGGEPPPCISQVLKTIPEGCCLEETASQLVSRALVE